MQYRSRSCFCHLFSILFWVATSGRLCAQASSSGSSSSIKHHKTAGSSDTDLDPGLVSGGTYRNKTLGLTCAVPAGWVLRTEEMNVPGEQGANANADSGSSSTKNSSTGEKVLLAAFSRPPEAKGSEINSSILIAAESVTSYPGLKDPEQYFEPLTEVAKAQGFEVDEEPYDLTIGSKTLVRGDFHRDVGSRVMRQSTLVMLAHGYAVSITLIAGSEDEIDDLINGLDFSAGRNAPARK